MHKLKASEIAAVRQQAVEKAGAESALAGARAFSKIVSATAHDLRTPSSAIQSGTRVLNKLFHSGQMADEGVHERFATVLELVSAASKTGMSFIESMALSAEFLDGRSVRISMSFTSLRDLIDNTLATARLAGPTMGSVAYHVNIQEGIEDSIYSDPCMLSRNLLNYLCNAGKHTSKGSIEVNVTLQKADVPGVEEYLRIAVVDTGSGLCEGHGNIWQPFVSMDESTGLGLYVVQKQCAALKGNCGMLEHEERGGCEFWFCVPYTTNETQAVVLEHKAESANGHAYSNLGASDLSKIYNENHSQAQPHAEAVPQQQLYPASDAATQGRYPGAIQGACLDTQDTQRTCSAQGPPTLLVIDDTQSILQLLAHDLQAGGFTVRTALGPTEGMESLKVCTYDLILCDFKMPLQNGDELAIAFRQWEKFNRPVERRQTIYALTAYPDSVRDRCLAAGMDGVLQKPLDLETVGDIVSSLQCKCCEVRV